MSIKSRYPNLSDTPTLGEVIAECCSSKGVNDKGVIAALTESVDEFLLEKDNPQPILADGGQTFTPKVQVPATGGQTFTPTSRKA